MWCQKEFAWKYSTFEAILRRLNNLKWVQFHLNAFFSSFIFEYNTNHMTMTKTSNNSVSVPFSSPYLDEQWVMYINLPINKEKKNQNQKEKKNMNSSAYGITSKKIYVKFYGKYFRLGFLKMTELRNDTILLLSIRSITLKLISSEFYKHV